MTKTLHVEDMNSSVSFLDEFISIDDTANMQLESEVSKYSKHTILTKVDPTIWWIENKTTYPRLYKLFKRLSCIPASSEREFSTAGNIITDKRSLILPNNVNDILVARNSIYCNV